MPDEDLESESAKMQTKLKIAQLRLKAFKKKLNEANDKLNHAQKDDETSKANFSKAKAKLEEKPANPKDSDQYYQVKLAERGVVQAQDAYQKSKQLFADHTAKVEAAKEESHQAIEAALQAVELSPEGLPDEDKEAVAASKETRLTIAKIRAKAVQKKMDLAQSALNAAQTDSKEAKDAYKKLKEKKPVVETVSLEQKMMEAGRLAKVTRAAANKAIAESEEGMPDEELEADAAQKEARLRIATIRYKSYLKKMQKATENETEHKNETEKVTNVVEITTLTQAENTLTLAVEKLRFTATDYKNQVAHVKKVSAEFTRARSLANRAMDADMDGLPDEKLEAKAIMIETHYRLAKKNLAVLHKKTLAGNKEVAEARAKVDKLKGKKKPETVEVASEDEGDQDPDLYEIETGEEGIPGSIDELEDNFTTTKAIDA